MQLLVAVLTLVSSQLSAVELTGKWEVQSMGADREIAIQQKGPEIVAHRVMWPEFEGQRYKLEHLYRGTVKGNQITGELLVKEPELKDFEVLRDFTGTLAANGSVTIDGLPLKRVDAPASAQAAAAASPPPPPAAKATAAPPPPPPAAKPTAAPPPPPPAAVTPPAPPPSAPASATPAAPTPPAKPSAPAVAQAPAKPSPGAPPPPPVAADAGTATPAAPPSDALFKVPANTMPSKAATLTKEGDKLLKNKQWAAALAKFQAAEAQGAGDAALWHRIGTCDLYLERYEDAKTQLRRALKLDPHNPVLLRDYNRAKMLSE